MFVDTHCHINLMIKKTFATSIAESQLALAQPIIDEAAHNNVSLIINVGTDHSENENCILIAQKFSHVYATIGIHPNDSQEWKKDSNAMKKMLLNKTENKIVGIGECGMDRHYPNHNLVQQRDAFKAQIELALEHNLGLVVHSRDAYDETLTILEEYKNDIKRAVMHCFSYDQTFASTVIDWHYMLGIGGTVTYPKNNDLRSIVQTIPLEHIVLETDAPFLPIQEMRGKQNHPLYIKNIAEYIAQLRSTSLQQIEEQTTKNALYLFGLEHI